MTYVSDTHALVWLLEDDPQLSGVLRQSFQTQRCR
jgi:PIN domain nuclease of toxin-antitoxin system